MRVARMLPVAFVPCSPFPVPAVAVRLQRVPELLLELFVELVEIEALVLRARVLDLQRTHQVAHAADGQPVEVRGCDFFTFKNGKIAKKDSYWKIREVGS